MTAFLLRGLATLLARTWRLEIVGEEHVRRLRAARTPIVFTVWHAELLAPLWHRRGERITLLVSGHTDGGYLAGAAIAWGYHTVRGSSTRGAVGGTLGLVRVLRGGGDVAVTPDGPRGPARQAKSGAASLARATGAAIVPVAARSPSAWRTGSWDGFMIPRPFARVRVAYGRPLRIAGGEDERTDAGSRLHEALAAAGRHAGC